MATTAQINFLVGLYAGYFDRAPDPAGLQFWINQVDNGRDINTIAADFAASSEATAKFPYLTAPGLVTPTTFITQIYQSLFNRAPDAAGLSFWEGQLSSGTVSAGDMISAIIQGAVDDATATPPTNDKTILDNKTAVGLDFAQDAAATSGFTFNAAAQAAASAALDNVDATAASVTAAQSATDTFLGGTGGGGSATGSTFTLTENTDNLTGTANDDTFNGVVQAAGADGTTAAPGDSINGGAGDDTARISFAGDSGGGGYTLSALQLTGVENLLASNFDTGAGDTTIDTSLMSGLTTVGLAASGADGDTIFTGMNSVLDARMENGSADLTLTYNAAAVAGTSDVQDLAVSNVTAGTFTANGTETINITGGLVKSTLTGVASDALKTVTITGDKDLTITNAIDFVAGTNNDTTIDATIDGSAMTGKLNVTADLNDTKITGGSADDTINMVGFLTKNDIVDGGAGTDTLTLDAAALTDQFAQVSNIETVRFNANDGSGAGRTYDVSKLSTGVTTVAIDVDDNGGNAETISNLGTQAVVIRNSSDDGGANTVAITGATDTADDTLNVTLIETIEDGDNNDIDTLTVSNFETVNLVSSKESATTGAIINNVDTLNAESAKSVVVTGNSELVIDSITGGAMTAFDASGLAGKLTATFGTNDKVTATAAQQDTTFNFGTTLNNEDTVVGGAGTKDKVTATVNGLTATTGALKVSGVETLELTTGGANTLDFSSITGLSTLQVSANTQTLTKFDLATKVVSTDSNTLDVTAADATGTSDTLTLEYKGGDTETNVVKASDIENLSVILNDTDVGADTQTLTLTDFKGTSVSVSQSADSVAARNVDLGTVNATVTTVDMSGTKGTQAVNVSNATTATTVGLSGAGVATVTGSAQADTFNVTETGDVTHVINGGAGTDTLNIAVAAGFDDVNDITNVENVNVTVKAGNDVDIDEGDFTTGVDNIKILGGNSLSTFTTGTLVTEIQTLDASGFGGNIVATLTKNAADNTFTITGGSLATDELNYQIDATGTDTLQSTGVEILDLDVDETSTLDLTNTTGVTTVDVDISASDTFTIDKMTNQTVKISAAAANDSVVEAKLANASGTSDVVNFELNGTIADGAQLKTDDVETVNVKVSTNAESISLANLAMTASGAVMSLNVTGDKALTVSALNADVTTIDASGMATGGSFVQTGRSNTGVQTATGSAGDDTFIMANAGDVLNAGAGTGDTLDINFNAILGGIQVDLSQTGDQVTTFNGSANAAVQQGFENVDLAGYTGTFGAEVTAAAGGSTITGTANADQINGGAGVDNITGGAGNDVITLGSGADTIVFSGSNTADNGSDTISTVQTADKYDFSGVLTNGQIANTTAGPAISLATTAALETEGTSIAVADDRVYVAEVANKADIDSAADIATALANTGVMDAVDFATNAEAILIVGGADDDTTHYIYGINNDGTAAVAEGEITLIGTVTTDITNGVDGLLTTNFVF